MKYAVVPFLLLIAQLAAADGPQVSSKVKDPVPTPVPVKRITPEKLTGKPGKLLTIDASKATGDVIWDYSEATFDGDSVLVDSAAKKLTLVMPPAQASTQTFTVTMFSATPFCKERVTITVPGSTDPTPPDGPVTLDTLKASIDALTKAVSGIDARVAALEKKPPTPLDPFTQAVQNAYVADGSPKQQAQLMASIYGLSNTVVNDTNNKNLSDVLTKMHSAIQIGLKEPDITKVSVLVNTRKLLEQEFNAVLGTKDAALTPALRTTIMAEFAKAQAVLQAVSQ